MNRPIGPWVVLHALVPYIGFALLCFTVASCITLVGVENFVLLGRNITGLNWGEDRSAGAFTILGTAAFAAHRYLLYMKSQEPKE